VVKGITSVVIEEWNNSRMISSALSILCVSKRTGSSAGACVEPRPSFSHVGTEVAFSFPFIYSSIYKHTSAQTDGCAFAQRRKNK
jgi:hypothetical protein